MLTALSALAVALVTAAGGILTTIVGRRQPWRPHTAERRDDFTAVTNKLGEHITRLERRVDEQEADAERDRQQLSAQDVTLRYMTGWLRVLVQHIRAAGSEPPPPPEPVPEHVRTYLHDVGL